MRLFLFAILLAVNLSAVDRCTSYVREVRIAHFKEFGLDFPYQYGVAQLLAESNCRDIISNDGVGSQGVAQITYRLWQKVLDEGGIKSISSSSNSIKAQALIMKHLHKPEYPLWVTYQLYNGGSWVLKEIRKAGATDWDKAKAQCTRGNSKFTTSKGVVYRSNCDINYSYSKEIFKYGKRYANSSSSLFRFW